MGSCGKYLDTSNQGSFPCYVFPFLLVHTWSNVTSSGWSGIGILQVQVEMAQYVYDVVLLIHVMIRKLPGNYVHARDTTQYHEQESGIHLI